MTRSFKFGDKVSYTTRLGHGRIETIRGEVIGIMPDGRVRLRAEDGMTYTVHPEQLTGGTWSYEVRGTSDG